MANENRMLFSRSSRSLVLSMSAIIKETWQAFVTNCDTQLEQVFVNKTARQMFKEQADRLSDRRNHAM